MADKRWQERRLAAAIDAAMHALDEIEKSGSAIRALSMSYPEILRAEENVTEALENFINALNEGEWYG